MAETPPVVSKEGAPVFKKARDLKEGDKIKIPIDYIRQMMDENNWEPDNNSRLDVEFIMSREGGYPAFLVGCDGVVQWKHVVDGKEQISPRVLIQTWPVDKTFPTSEYVDYLSSIPGLGWEGTSREDIEWDILRHFKKDEKEPHPTELNYRQLISLWKFHRLDPDQIFEVLP